MDILKARLGMRMRLAKALWLLEGSIATRIEVTKLPDELASGEAESSATAHPRYGFMTPSMRTEELARELRTAMRAKVACGHLEPIDRRHDPDALVAELTKLRQAVDRLGIAYDFFAQEALRYFVNRSLGEGEDMPTLERLLQVDVLEFVASRWGAPGDLGRYRDDATKWDRRLRLRKNRQSPQQEAMLEFVVDQVHAIEAHGSDGSRVLRKYLDKKVISEVEARRRFSADLVDRAMRPGDDVQDAIEAL